MNDKYIFNLCFFITALLRYKSRTVKFTHVECTIQCLYNSMIPNNHYNFRTFLSPSPQENPVPISNQSFPPNSYMPGATKLLSVSIDMLIADILYKCNHIICGLCV